MSWTLARVARACARCGRTIEPGKRCRVGDVAQHLAWCDPCAAYERFEPPPSDVVAAPVLPRLRFELLLPPALRQRMAEIERMHDGRQAATGERP